MARRNVLDNSSCHHFLSNLTPSPVANGTLFGLLTGQCYQLTDLLGGDLRGPSWTWDIGQAFAHGEVFEGDGLQTNPVHPPLAHRVHAGTLFSGDLPVCVLGIFTACSWLTSGYQLSNNHIEYSYDPPNMCYKIGPIFMIAGPMYVRIYKLSFSVYIWHELKHKRA
jgi:hypothetical protein